MIIGEGFSEIMSSGLAKRSNVSSNIYPTCVGWPMLDLLATLLDDPLNVE